LPISTTCFHEFKHSYLIFIHVRFVISILPPERITLVQEEAIPATERRASRRDWPQSQFLRGLCFHTVEFDAEQTSRFLYVLNGK
jgi:hypothetical protein